MRNATCAASKTSKVPTQDALLFISYSMTKVRVELKYKKTICHGYGTDNVVGHAHLYSSITMTNSADL